jgi:hypothetical protein
LGDKKQRPIEFFGKPERKRSFGRPRGRFEDNIKMGFKR